MGVIGDLGFPQIGETWYLVDFAQKGVFRPFDFPILENQLSEIPTIEGVLIYDAKRTGM